MRRNVTRTNGIGSISSRESRVACGVQCGFGLSVWNSLCRWFRPGCWTYQDSPRSNCATTRSGKSRAKSRDWTTSSLSSSRSVSSQNYQSGLLLLQPFWPFVALFCRKTPVESCRRCRCCTMSFSSFPLQIHLCKCGPITSKAALFFSVQTFGNLQNQFERHEFLQFNLFIFLPPSLFTLEQLELLDVSYNRLKELPSEIRQLR